MTDWIDKFLAIGSTPDWITPAIGLTQSIAKDSAYIRFSRHSWSVNEAKRKLKKAGIKSWNDYVDGSDGVLCVAPKDEEKARGILEGY